MVLLLFFIYLIPVAFVFCIVLKLGLWLAINLFQLAVWLLKHVFVLLWKLLVFIAVLVFACLRSSPPPK
ncbi:membrane protein [Prevotella sp. CAG:891]|nr:membrane protein [Prevotella sp. CAG:891]